MELGITKFSARKELKGITRNERNDNKKTSLSRNKVKEAKRKESDKKANEGKGNNSNTLEKLVYKVIGLIDEIIAENQKKKDFDRKFKSQSKSIFNIKNGSVSLGIGDYLKRITAYLELSENELVYTLMMVDQIVMESDLILTEINVHKLLLIGTYLTIKVLRDHIYHCDIYPRIYGITMKEIAIVESETLERLNYKVNFNYKKFFEYKAYIESF